MDQSDRLNVEIVPFEQRRYSSGVKKMFLSAALASMPKRAIAARSACGLRQCCRVRPSLPQSGRLFGAMFAYRRNCILVDHPVERCVGETASIQDALTGLWIKKAKDVGRQIGDKTTVLLIDHCPPGFAIEFGCSDLGLSTTARLVGWYLNGNSRDVASVLDPQAAGGRRVRLAT